MPGRIKKLNSLDPADQNPAVARIQQLAVQEATVGILLTDPNQPDNPVTYCNRFVEKLTGYSKAEIIGNNIRLLYGDDRDQLEIGKIRAAVEKQQHCQVVVRNYRKNGQMFWNEVTISPVFDDQRHLLAYVGFLKDITQQKRAEQKLREREENFRLISEASIEGIFCLDKRGMLTFVNPALSKMVGRVVDELLGHPLTDFLGKKTQLSRDKISRILKGEAITGELSVVHASGNEFPVRFSASPIRKNSRIVGVSGMIRDISAIKRMEEQKANFIADATHELRTPLAIIQSCLDLATGERSRPQVDPYEMLDTIASEIGQMSDILSELSMMASNDSGSRVHSPDPLIDLNASLRNIVRNFEPLARKSGAQVFLSLTKDAKIMINRSLFEKVIGNLISNALRYGRRGGFVKIRSRAYRHYVKIEVEDNGIGIPASAIGNVFQRFYRVDKARSRETGGSGLGLSICKQIVEAHHGEISVQSQLSEGSLFTVILPR